MPANERAELNALNHELMKGMALQQAQGPKNIDAHALEILAKIQHDIWSHWMKYLFSVSMAHEGGTATISAENVERWTRQMGTAYDDLSEREKQSDRDVVMQFLGPDTGIAWVGPSE